MTTFVRRLLTRSRAVRVRARGTDAPAPRVPERQLIDAIAATGLDVREHQGSFFVVDPATDRVQLRLYASCDGPWRPEDLTVRSFDARAMRTVESVLESAFGPLAYEPVPRFL